MTTRRPSAPIPGQAALIAADAVPPSTDQVMRACERILWEAVAEPALLDHAATGVRFTSFDVARARRIPEPGHHNWWGLLLARLHRDGLLEPVGWDQSHRPSSGRSGVRVWRGANCGERAA